MLQWSQLRGVVSPDLIADINIYVFLNLLNLFFFFVVVQYSLMALMWPLSVLQNPEDIKTKEEEEEKKTTKKRSD